MNEQDILDKVNTLRPNPYGSFLGDYLKSLDIRIRAEIMDESAPVYDSDNLALPQTESEVYVLHLFSVIDFLNGEYGKYQNSTNAFISEYSRLSRKAEGSRSNPERSYKIWNG